MAIPREDDIHSALRLVAFYTTSVTDGKSPVRTGDLKSFLSKRLPVHMVPAEYVQLDRHPRTATGKIDRLRLRSEPVPTAPVDESTAQATQSREGDSAGNMETGPRQRRHPGDRQLLCGRRRLDTEYRGYFASQKTRSNSQSS